MTRLDEPPSPLPHWTWSDVAELYQSRCPHACRLATSVLRADPAAGGSFRASAFTRDTAFVAGLATSGGAITVFVPPPSSVVSLPLTGRRAAGQMWCRVGQTNLRAGLAWIGEVGVRHWAELHVDDRYLDDFNQEGLIGTYQVAATLLASRPDIAGLRSLS